METQANVNGGALVLRGVLAILFGIAAVFWPGLTLVTLVYLFSAFILVNGLLSVIFGIGRLVGGSSAIWVRILAVLIGFLELGVGVYLLRHPGVSFATFVLLIGFSLIIRGVVEIVGGLFEDAPSFNKVMMVMVGVLTGLAGIVVLFQPAASGVAFVWILGIYSLITGPLLIALAMEVNKAEKAVLAR